MTEQEELAQAIRDAAPKLAAALASIRSTARVVNDLGALASLLQREAQDVEAIGPDLAPALRAFLDGSFLQRTGSVNDQSAKLAESCRRIMDAIRCLDSDGQKVLALLAEDQA